MRADPVGPIPLPPMTITTCTLDDFNQIFTDTAAF